MSLFIKTKKRGGSILVLLITLGLIVCSCVGCNNTNQPPIDTEDDETQETIDSTDETAPAEDTDETEILIESSTDELLETTDPVESESESTAPNPDDIKITEIQTQNTTLTLNDAQLLDVSPLYYTEVLGSRKRYENSIPAVIGFEYPYMFYERASEIVENSSSDDAALYIGRYSLETKEFFEFEIEQYAAISNEATLVVDQDRIIYMYCVYQDSMKMVIEMFDYSTQTRKVISTYSVHNVFGYAKELKDDKLVFMLYESVAGATQQVVLTYDLRSEQLQEIYRGESMSGYNASDSTKDIWAIDANKGSVYLHMQQMENGAMKSYYRVLDEHGNILRDTYLPSLHMYDTVKDAADSMVVKDNYAFIHYDQRVKYNNDEASCAILYFTNDESCLLEMNAPVSISYQCGSGYSNIPYVFFAIHDNNETLWVCNVERNKGFIVAFAEAGVHDFGGGPFIIDQAGNLLVKTRTNDKTDLYLFSGEYLADIFT